MQITLAVDRRQIFRPFLERLNPASLISVRDLIVLPEHDPRDPDQPPIHVSFANSAELSRGVQMAIVGGIGSGKTTELQLTLTLLTRHEDAITIYMDLAETTDLSQLNPGAILIAIGFRIHGKLKDQDRKKPGIQAAYARLLELASGRTHWVPADEYYDPNEDDEDSYETRLVPVHTPGLLKPRFPALNRSVAEVRSLVLEIATPLLEAEAQITVLIDGLDRLIQAERFREFAEQDLRALRDTKISVIVAAPLLMWFDNSRFIQDYFDEVKHIPAAIWDPAETGFLNQILRKRGAAELMADQEIVIISRFSGGVLRDLITLARTSAEAAYRDDRDRIGPEDVQSAARQLGKRYLVGLGRGQLQRIWKLIENKEFSMEDPIGKELLVNRQVLEYNVNHRDVFAVHPALAEVLPELE